MQFNQLRKDELKAIGEAAGNEVIKKHSPTPDTLLTLVLAPDPTEKTVAHLFLEGTQCELDKGQLAKVRACLPSVQFIRSDVAFSDQIPIHSLLSAYNGGTGSSDEVFDFAAAQKAARLLYSLVFGKEKPSLSGEDLQKLSAEHDALGDSRFHNGQAELELQLFRDVLGISETTIQFVAGLGISDRTHADGLIARWNREIEERLNLSHYWTQDDSFALRLNYKQGLLYFEITDKTGATYTFRERSSGLRFFLSYYIQAKALESVSRTKPAIVLMDEPDSFLSIIGQKNLLSVFESLVKPESSGQNCQLLYTTHSPFLINRNFPHRLRLVRKGDAEEGTQLIDQAMLRRYEPVRSALGIDCSQTLFMGATNVVVEGPTDQFLICELIRAYARPDNISELLDLNSVVMVSAESAPSVEKLLSASQWGDESVPATVVLVDSDDAGDEIKKRITGKARKCKKLIDEEFVIQVGAAVTNSHPVKTTEDILPLGLFKRAVMSYLDRWWEDLEAEARSKVGAAMDEGTFANNGVVEGANKVLSEHVFKAKRTYDKYGVLQEVVRLIQQGDLEEDQELLKRNVFKLCEEIRRAVSASQQAARRESGKQAVKRLIDDFFVQNKESSSVFDTQLLLERVQRDLQLLGSDGEVLDGTIKRLLAELRKLRSAGHHRLTSEVWKSWSGVLAAMQKNPLQFVVEIKEGVPSVPTASAEPLTTAAETIDAETVATEASASV
ncbi:ATP-dependent nuclease [Planctomicrobium sp. SH664]|uniref:ATP-dependent nuclease n=1 Tax=Planctomicrobium sp. SH664 TaxID=3448125 RepID=UPI003F5B1F15